MVAGELTRLVAGKVAVKRESDLVGQKVLAQPQGGSGPNQGK